MQLASEGRERMDRDGAHARRGQLDPALLEQLLDDEFLRRPPPKSTGRERYGLAEAEALHAAWRAAGRPTDDLVATLVAFTVEAVARQPEMRSEIMGLMFLGLALTEAIVFYALLMGFVAFFIG